MAGVDAALFYDDESADPIDAVQIQGITDIQPGEAVIVVITGSTDDVNTFTDVWSPVIILDGVEVGFADGAALGSGGDVVTLWLGDPNSTLPVDSEAYPVTADLTVSLTMLNLPRSV